MLPKHTTNPKKIFIILTLSILILSSLRISWVVLHESPEHMTANNGILDVSNWSFNDKQTMTLDGEWKFYPNQFIEPNEPIHENSNFLTVPSDWKEYFVDKDIPAYGHGTYQLKILLPDDQQKLYGLRFESITTSSRVFVNGELVGKHGNTSNIAINSMGKPGPFQTIFHTDSNEINLIIHVSNYEIPFWGGISESVKFGTEAAITTETAMKSTSQIVVSIIYLLHGMYALSIYFLGRGQHQRELLYYGLTLAINALAIIIDDEVVLQLPLPLETYLKLLLLIFITTLIMLLTFIKHLFRIKSRFYSMLLGFFIILSIGELIIPFRYFIFLGIFVAIFYILSFVFLYKKTIQAIRKHSVDAIFILIFITSYTSNAIWGALVKLDLISIPYYPFDHLISIIAIAFILFKRHIDITKLNKKQTVELKKADKKKDQFLMNTSHELRNPLHGVINIAQTILEDEANHLSNKNKSNLNLLIKIGKSMSYTLNDILDITRLKDGQIQLNKERVSLSIVSSGVIDMLRIMADGKDLEFHNKVDERFPEVEADEKRLIQILFNLLHNAVKYTNDGHITIDAKSHNNNAIIFVKDTGIGMSDETRRQIFQPYFQEEPNTTLVEGGLGIGLGICKQLVELHGGTISVESTLREGTTFIFTLPLADIDSKVDKKQTTQTSISFKNQEVLNSNNEPLVLSEASTKGKLLMVDDDPVNLRIMKQLLSKNFSVETATSAKEAMNMLNRKEWDLIISDVMMPNTTGYELTRLIREQYTRSELPILLLTARHQSEDIYAGFQAGANDYVTKPVDKHELHSRVMALTESKKSFHEQLRMEAALLQAQIQPHFLYNTLNTIASLSEIDKERMTKLLNEFGHYLRRSFAQENTKTLIPLESEIELVRSYLYIKKERFGSRLNVKWEIDDLSDVKVPPLSIQTLVENAVRHGVLKRTKGGTVYIHISNHSSYTQVMIRDDGIGMDQERIDKILKEHPMKEVGIGLRNTNRRLMKLYGKGLMMESYKNIGTIVKFHIPHNTTY